MSTSITVAIVGGGASGMTAALKASERACVTLFERQQRLGRKLSVTGNGRCNLSNRHLSAGHYHGAAPDFPAAALSRFPVEETIAFFRSLGLLTVTEDSGRIYPYSDQAGSVVDVLRLALPERGVTVRTGVEVTGLRRTPEGFLLTTGEGESLLFDRVIVAAGGVAGTKLGSTDLGYRLLRGLGHRVTDLAPSLVPLKTENTWTRPLKGVRAPAWVAAMRGSECLASLSGEVQFTEYGVSGPAVFDISRMVTTAAGRIVLHLDLLEPLEAGELLALLRERLHSGLTLENLLTGVLHNKLGRTVLSRCGLSLTAPAASLTEKTLVSIVRCVKDYTLPVTGHTGMENAQVTAGGVLTAELDPATLESRLVPGLFACGEVLDVDGSCGGYNLQWAWSSGLTAGLLGEVST